MSEKYTFIKHGLPRLDNPGDLELQYILGLGYPCPKHSIDPEILRSLLWSLVENMQDLAVQPDKQFDLVSQTAPVKLCQTAILSLVKCTCSRTLGEDEDDE